MMTTTPSAFVREIAADVIAEHTAPGGCCSTSEPCEIVAYYQQVLGGSTVTTQVTRVAGDEADQHRPTGGSRGANQYGEYKVRVPSAKQVAFIDRLLAERVIPADKGEQSALAAFRKGTANLRQASDLISWLTTLPINTTAPVAPANLASDKQVAAVIREFERRAVVGDARQAILTAAYEAAKAGNLSKRAASQALDDLFSMPFAQRKQSADDLEAGIYLVDGEVYKVQKAVHGSGHMYAKHLVAVDGKGTFEYASGAISRIKPEHRMNLEQAKQYGAVYGVCCNCGRTLTDEVSIEAGIGPVCAKRFA